MMWLFLIKVSVLCFGLKMSCVMYFLGILGSWWENMFWSFMSYISIFLFGFWFSELFIMWNLMMFLCFFSCVVLFLVELVDSKLVWDLEDKNSL